MVFRFGFVFLLAVALLGGDAQRLPAQDVPTESLRQLIDRHTLPVTDAKPAICTDAEFLRRVSLDLTGVPPTADAARAFLADSSADKRVRLVDQLMASPHYARHMAESIDLMLMERRANKHVSADEWHNYLNESVKTNKPWNVLAREILIADGDKASPRAAVRFYLDRAAEPHVLARDVGRIFFGRDMQCAQCHDHPLINDYHQRDYHGLLAFMLPGYQLARKTGKTTKTYYAERSGGDVAFTSVFIAGVNHTTRARVIGNEPLVEPVFLPGNEYKVAPAANVISIPKFSRRAILANDTTNGTNDAFNRNIANRLWAHMMGRGLVHPVDLHHSANPPSHPELLSDLSQRFVSMKFDTKQFLREIALSSTYQRSIDLPANLMLASQNAAKVLPQLTTKQAELEKKSEATQAAFDKAAEVRDKAELAFLPALAAMNNARKSYAGINAKLAAANVKLKPAEAKRVAKEKVAAPVLQANLAAEAASKAVPSDKELATAFATLKKKSDALQVQLAALKKAEAPLIAAVTAQVKALDAPKKAIETSETKLKPLRDAVTASEKAALSTRRVMEQAATLLAKMETQVTHVEQLAGYSLLNSQWQSAQAVVKTQTAKLAGLKTTLATANSELAKAQTDQKTAVAAMTAATSRLKSASSNRDSKSAAAQVIGQLATSAKTAAAKLPSDKQLVTTATTLVARSAAAQQELTNAKSEATAADTLAKQAAATFAAKQSQMLAAQARQAPLAKQVEDMSKAVATANSTLGTVGPKLNETVDAITTGWSADFTVADLKPLAPEQLCWSILTVSGVYQRYELVEEAAVNKAKPLTDAIKADAAQMSDRRITIERATWKKLKSNVGTFAKIYGAGAGQPQGDFFATADQALFAGNGGTITGWLNTDGKNIAHRMNTEADIKKATEDLYLTLLTRFPTDAEVTDVAAHLANRKDKPVAIQELIWGLITSVEFRFNH
jgi:hypothetical protein